MSKTFKSNHPDNKVLKVDDLFGNPRLLIKEFDGDTRGFVFASSDAAELMLAIGDTLPVPDMVREGSYEHFLGSAIHCLAKAVKARESEVTEARERAELEAEAEKLYRVYFETAEVDYKNWSKLDQRIKDYWLAVARRARELAQEGK